MNNEIISDKYSVFFKKNGFYFLKNHIKKFDYSKIFIHVDNNTKEYCLDYFLKEISLEKFEIIESEDGEENKNIKSCLKLWDSISSAGGDRNSLLINLGGGVVTDMGGFIASTFKRGINYVNVPTTLLSMVDASVGGKTGIDFGILKNQIGTFYDPQGVIVDPFFLNTLSENQILSGYAEIFKHSLISENQLFKDLIKHERISYDLKTIYQSIQVKNNIVLVDKKESKERKSLNFGHTLGHAIESFFLNTNKKLLHGEAISIGIILASFISNKLFNFSEMDLKSIKSHLDKLYNKVEINDNEIDGIIELLKHDKKNSHGNINFILIKEIGKPVYDIKVSNELIKESFKYYLSWISTSVNISK